MARLSRVAGIVERETGKCLRVVVSDGPFEAHVASAREIVVVVPNYRLREPVPVARYGEIVSVVESYVKSGAWRLSCS